MAAMPGLAQLSSTATFDEACDAVVRFLKVAVPMGVWLVNRTSEGRQVFLSIADDVAGLQPGDYNTWTEGFCQFMVTGEAPRVAPDILDVPLYKSVPVASAMGIRAYVGMPITRPNGELFGTLCGIDLSAQAEHLSEQEPMLQLLSQLLAIALEADQARTDVARRAEKVSEEAASDPLTGLLNRRGWDRYLGVEEARYRRFGDPGSIIVIDLDGLKAINDSYGHTAGDEHLQLAAATLRSVVRDSDVVARLGGDEFGIVAARTPAKGAERLVVRIRNGLDAAGVAASVGCAPYTITSGFPGAWELADTLMYADKTLRRSARGALADV